MPRGRHRHSPPLHRLLPPTAVAGVSVVLAAGAWFVDNSVALRLLTAAASAAAVTGAVIMRSWDHTAGRRVADLARARVRDEWRSDERIAELEMDLDESRELRVAMEAKLRAKRGELARLRNEHASLLRRYATAETERASALEGRRLLALEASVPSNALPASPEDGMVDANGAPTPAAYVKAAKALTELVRNGARQEVQRTLDAARRGKIAERGPETDGADRPDGSVGPRGRHAGGVRPSVGDRDARDSGDASSAADRDRTTVPATAALVPYAPRPRRRDRGESGFDFFGNKTTGRKRLDSPRRPAPPSRPPEAAQQQAPEPDTGAEAARADADAPVPDAPVPEQRVADPEQRVAEPDPDAEVADGEPEAENAMAQPEPADVESPAQDASVDAVDAPSEAADADPEAAEAVDAHPEAAEAADAVPEAADGEPTTADAVPGPEDTEDSDAVEDSDSDSDGKAPEAGSATDSAQAESANSGAADGDSATADHGDAIGPDEDLADVVGTEALAAASAQRDSGEIIDLTEHDETEQIDVRGLRAHSS